MEGNVLEIATKYCNDYNYNRKVLSKFFSSLDKPTENQTQPQATSPIPVSFIILLFKITCTFYINTNFIFNVFV